MLTSFAPSVLAANGIVVAGYYVAPVIVLAFAVYLMLQYEVIGRIIAAVAVVAVAAWLLRADEATVEDALTKLADGVDRLLNWISGN